MASSLSSLRQFQLIGVIDTGRIIGNGSYATVIEVEFHGLRCAGKKIHSVLLFDAPPQARAAMLQRFTEECELLSRLHHPCVVQFLGVYFEEGSQLPVLVMEFLHTTLSDCLSRYGILPEAISYGILTDVALGLRYLHEHLPPIVHRDLSANNVLLTASMRGKITDLGVAKILNLTPAQLTQAPGTPCYMPPEALRAKPTYTSKIDSYSYGVMVIHMLSGRWPFPTDVFRPDPQNPDVLFPVPELDRRAEYLRDIAQNHPLMELIRQCLSNNPTRRPEASEILRQITAIAFRHPERHQNVIEMNQYCEGRVQSERELRQACEAQLQLLRSQSLPELLPGTQSQPQSQLEEEIRILRSELRDKTQEINELHRQIRELESDRGHLCTEKNFFERQLQETETQLEDLRVHFPEKYEQQLEELRLRVQEKDEEIAELHHHIWVLLADKDVCTENYPHETETQDGYSEEEDGERYGYIEEEDGERDGYNEEKDGERDGYIEEEDGERDGYGEEKDGERDGYIEEEDGERDGYIEEEDGERDGYSEEKDGERDGYIEEEDGERDGYIEEEDGERDGYIEEDATSSAYPCSTSAPEEDSRSASDEDPSPRMWTTHTNPKKRWTLGDKLGKGSFGEVYICRHKVHTTEVLAVKVIEIFGNKMRLLESFTKEVSALKQVSKHNRIVEYIDTDIDVTTRGAVWLYIFMEYMPGGTLREYIQKYGGMELSHVRKCTRQLLEGVAHLHDNKIVHRDIKGANILRDSEGNIKLADFGCAKTLENISIDGKMSHEQGTICWRAPETVKKYQEALLYVFESDIWSVGATVIELITGEHPYHPFNQCSVVLILGSEEPDFKTPFDVCKIQDPDQHMVTFLSHCFRRNPSERLSAQKLLQTAKFCRIE